MQNVQNVHKHKTGKKKHYLEAAGIYTYIYIYVFYRCRIVLYASFLCCSADVRHGQAAVVPILLKAKASIDLDHTDYDSPLLIAAEEGHVEVLQMLCQQGARVTLARI